MQLDVAQDGVALARDLVFEQRELTINPLADPALALDLVLIEPSRRPLAPAAEAFLEILAEEARRLDARWRPARAGRRRAP